MPVKASKKKEKPKLSRIKKSIVVTLVVLGSLAMVVLLLNFEYFLKQTRFHLRSQESYSENANPDTSEVVAEQDLPAYIEKNTIIIESLGIKAPIVYPEEKSEEEFQRTLQMGVAQFPGTALAGQPGNMYLFGHSSDYPWAKGDYKTVFALLPEIKNGALVTVSDGLGKAYTYKVVDQFVAENSDLHLLAQDKSKHELTLQTSYPIGTALKRYIVKAELINN